MKINKYFRYICAIGLVAAMIVTGCSSSKKSDSNETGQDADSKFSVENTSAEAVSVEEFEIDTDINEDYTDEYYDANAKKVELKNTVTISEAGTYILSGTISDGQIIMNSSDSDKVRLVFNGVNITCSDGPAINIIDGKTIITLADGTENIVTDGTSYAKDEEATACIFSKKDLCINGSGSLSVNGNYKAGIKSKGDLRIINGNITVNSASDGIKGKDSVMIAGGKINITSGKDGIQSTNATDGRGYIIILGGEITVNSGKNGIMAETIVEIRDGQITVEKSDEGIEALYIRINGGRINVTSSDDGMNAYDGSGQDTGGIMGPGGRGRETAGQTSDNSIIPKIYINGGEIYVSASGDGIDSNGAIYMNGGTLWVDGPTSNGDGYFDCATEFTVSGGTLIGTGSSGMLELPGDNSTQNVLNVGSINAEAGTEIKLVDSNDEVVLAYTPSKAYQAVTFSSADIQTGQTYKVYCGTEEAGSVTIESILSYIGTTGGMNGGMGGRPDGNGQKGDRPDGNGPGRDKPDGNGPMGSGQEENVNGGSST